MYLFCFPLCGVHFTWFSWTFLYFSACFVTDSDICTIVKLVCEHSWSGRWKKLQCTLGPKIIAASSRGIFYVTFCHPISLVSALALGGWQGGCHVLCFLPGLSQQGAVKKGRWESRVGGLYSPAPSLFTVVGSVLFPPPLPWHWACGPLISHRVRNRIFFLLFLLSPP